MYIFVFVVFRMPNRYTAVEVDKIGAELWYMVYFMLAVYRKGTERRFVLVPDNLGINGNVFSVVHHAEINRFRNSWEPITGVNELGELVALCPGERKAVDWIIKQDAGRLFVCPRRLLQQVFEGTLSQPMFPRGAEWYAGMHQDLEKLDKHMVDPVVPLVELSGQVTAYPVTMINGRRPDVEVQAVRTSVTTPLGDLQVCVSNEQNNGSVKDAEKKDAMDVSFSSDTANIHLGVVEEVGTPEEQKKCLICGALRRTEDHLRMHVVTDHLPWSISWKNIPDSVIEKGITSKSKERGRQISKFLDSLKSKFKADTTQPLLELLVARNIARPSVRIGRYERDVLTSYYMYTKEPLDLKVADLSRRGHLVYWRWIYILLAEVKEDRAFMNRLRHVVY